MVTGMDESAVTHEIAACHVRKLPAALYFISVGCYVGGISLFGSCIFGISVDIW